MSCNQALLGKLIRSLGFFGCCEVCRLIMRASPQHLPHWTICWERPYKWDWLSALEWQCLESSDDGWTHPLHKTAMQVEITRKKKQKNKCGGTRNSRQGWKGPLHTPSPNHPRPTSDSLAQKRRQHFTHYGADKQLLGTDMLSPLVKILKNFHTSW